MKRTRRPARGAGAEGNSGRDRGEVETALRASEERLRLALEASDTGLWTWDVGTDAVSWSPEVYRMFGVAEGTLDPVKTSFLRLVLPDDREHVEAAIGAALAGHSLFECEFRVVRPDGKIFWAANRGRASYDAAGNPLQMLGTLTDITARKRAEEALVAADRRKDAFLATLAHELRSPLAPLRNGLEILRQTGDSAGAPVREMMERQVSHMVRLIDDLLDVSRITSGKVVLRKEDVTLQAAVALALEANRPLVDSAGHTLIVDLPDQPLWVHADPTRLAQVVGNLLGNAAKYTPPGGRISLSARREGDLAVVRVADDGLGIPPEMLAAVFEMFAQVDASLDRSRGGLGIGLALARQLVELHGGTLSAESPGPGRGSTFTVRLPALSVEPARAADPGPRPPPAAPGAGLRILVVDDNRDGADSLSLFLELRGHTTRTASSGPEALAVARAFAPDVVLLDIGLPGMSGYEVARELRAAPGPGRPLLAALTGWGSEEDKQNAMAAGFDVHLTKPVELAAVEALLAGCSPRERG